MQDWKKIYLEAVYAVFFENREIRFRVGKISAALDEILDHHNAEKFAFLTAYNPFSQPLSDAENIRRQSNLIKLLKSESLFFLIGYGTSKDESWQREESLLVLNITEENAVRIARKFEQNAIVFGRKFGIPQLIWTS